MGIFVSFHQKLAVCYILDYFGILFILDIDSVLIEFILWDQRLLREKQVSALKKTKQNKKNQVASL